ncbi:MAG: hypothetical protein ACREJM_01825, partial [Candidatus Saccharimonadales bacterium]
MPIVLLCLDGVSAGQAGMLLDRIPAWHKLLPHGSLKPLVPGPLSCFQVIWAEILWGKTWFELGASGYATPRGSLNEVLPVKEADLPQPCPVFAGTTKSMVVNVPILGPHGAGRVWLSDGSLPFGVAVSPPELASEQPFSNYQPRFTSCLPYALSDIRSTVTRCLDVERRRLACVSQLIRQDWDLCLIRVTAFDQLFHMVEPDVLFDEHFIAAEEIASFLTELSDCLDLLIASAGRARICVMSTLGHTPCIARVNLNALLEEGGFCSRIAQPEQLVAAQRRHWAALALAGGGKKNAAPAVTPSSGFELAHTQAVSSGQGSIHL